MNKGDCVSFRKYKFLPHLATGVIEWTHTIEFTNGDPDLILYHIKIDDDWWYWNGSEYTVKTADELTLLADRVK